MSCGYHQCLAVYVAVFLGISMLLTPTAGAAQFTKTPNDKTVKVGETVSIVWDYSVGNRNTEFQRYSPVWSYYDQSGTKYTTSSEDKFDFWKWQISPTCPARLKHRLSKADTATLVITNVSLADSGKYECELKLISGFVPPSSMQLTATVPPQFTPAPPSSTTIKEGDNLSIQCSAMGPPTPQVKWLHNGNILSQGQGSATLNIVNIKRSQSGIYECQASNNPNEQPAKTTTHLTVYYPPEINTSPDNTTVTQGDDIILKCQASCNPPATISWSSDHNVPIKPGHIASGGTLTIPNAVKSDAGKYICTAKNVYDGQVHTATAAAYVTVRYPPSIVHHSNIQIVNETDSLSLTCTANGYPVPTITWNKSPGTITPPNTGNVYTILSVKRSDAGTYTCTASNGIASDAMNSIQVTVQYKPSIYKTSSTNTIRSWKGNTMTLQCVVASGLPSPNFTWYKPNGDVIPCNKCSRTVSSQVTVQTGQDSGDYGLYRCLATNVVGSDQHYINVTQLFTPGRPSITVTDIEASAVIVRWTKPVYDGGSPFIQYKLVVDSKTYDINAPNTHKSISGLTKNTKYEVKFYAKNIAGYGSASSKVFTTKKQGPPFLPEVKVDIHQTSVTLVWSKPDENGGDIITKYTIYKKVIGMDGGWSKVAEVTATSYTVEDLDPGKKYSFIVTAINQYGESLKDDSKAKTVVIPVETTTATTTTVVEPTKGKSESRVCSKVVPRNCAEVLQNGCKKSGVYSVDPDGKGAFKVYCDQTTTGGGWTVFQTRVDGSVDFHRGWNDYKKDFGNLKGEFWLGLDKIHRLTHQARNRLRIELEDFKGKGAYAEYGNFAVSSERSKYKLLSLGTYRGTAGDALSYHRGYAFSTKDRDNDNVSWNCAASFKGAWWHTDCHSTNLNGQYHHGGHKSYADGINWLYWRGYYYSAKRAEMKMRRVYW